MKQLTIVAPDRPGLLAEVTDALAAAAVNIETFDAEAVAGTGVIRLSVDRYDVAIQALHLAGLVPVSEDALLVRLEDKPGALAAVAKRFRDAGLNVRSLRIVHTSGGQTVAAVAVERTAEAVALVSDILIA
ncbi:MAG: ACT domain-containing protein [Planctomycetes bacterium]|nr:ACT domain-containing protein [Planctomycetota bacterium]